MNYFEDIRPCNDDEIGKKLLELMQDEQFMHLMKNYFPMVDLTQIAQSGKGFSNLVEFQNVVIRPILESLISKAATSLTVSGEEQISSIPSVFLSNHRDIVMDPSLLALSLMRVTGNTCEIAIGDNLLATEWIRTLVRLNRCFIVKRGLTPRDMAKSFMQLSSYIRYAVTDKKVNVWIAQREGRAKDSNDRTQESLIKMLALSGNADFIENLKSLNICPLSISYEFDPCDYLKATEFQLKRDNADYKKTKADDVLSMQTGIMGWKGRVHYAFTESINAKLDEIAQSGMNKKDQAAAVCALCDHQIHAAYQLYPINRWAYEQLTGDTKYANVDTAEERAMAEKYLRGQLAKINIPNKDEEYLWHKLLEMYANPFINAQCTMHNA
ncbi:MAG: 1-acyl-sn-glycerol-3-phosphate acyltransferase [Paludibacteraceae bacterium]|nr:1-acyl-sn-glycerol-3-phosphate acyltransferase [Paludibacteraceae bacterium]